MARDHETTFLVPKSMLDAKFLTAFITMWLEVCWGPHIAEKKSILVFLSWELSAIYHWGHRRKPLASFLASQYCSAIVTGQRWDDRNWSGQVMFHLIARLELNPDVTDDGQMIHRLKLFGTL
jgi:hypothetical protein